MLLRILDIYSMKK